jgi:hypothetical protein
MRKTTLVVVGNVDYHEDENEKMILAINGERRELDFIAWDDMIEKYDILRDALEEIVKSSSYMTTEKLTEIAEQALIASGIRDEEPEYDNFDVAEESRMFDLLEAEE